MLCELISPSIFLKVFGHILQLTVQLSVILQYPQQLRNEEYDLKFAIRGLHFDTKECLLMKLDQFSVVQDGTCYRYIFL